MTSAVKRAPQALQLTLAILKPDVIANPIARADIHQLILHHDFLFVRSKRLNLSRARAAQFYSEHEGRFFYNRLVSYMSSGPISAHILARQDAIATWRMLMGPTKVFRTLYEAPDSIRGRYGLTDTRNCTHGSDSEQSAKKEMKFFFPDFDIERWYIENELEFRNKNVEYNKNFIEHSIRTS